MSTIWVFDHLEKKKHILYRGKDFLQKFFESFTEHAKNIFDSEKKKNVTVNKKITKKLHQDAKVYYICGKRFIKKLAKGNNYQKVRVYYCYTGQYRSKACSIFNLWLNVPNETFVIFLNWSNYDYHFIMKELLNEFEEFFDCLGENTETFSVPKEK